MKIMIAGGLGYIGSALCELYRDAPEHQVIVVDRQFIGERVASLPERTHFVQGDIRDTDLMRHLVRDVDVLYLLAAEVEAENSIHKDRAIWETNYDATKSLIELTSSSTRIMFPSTGNVFGGVDESQKYMNLTEEDEPKPKYPYAEAKYAMENYLLRSNRDFVILRFGTNHGYAPGIRFNLVTNNFMRKALLGQELTVHGSGANYRPTACVKDCARALRFMSTHGQASGQIFHVVRESYRIKDLAETVCSLFDNGARVTHIAKEVPFSAYALSSDKIRAAGFTFEWDLEKSVMDMQRVFRAMILPPDMQLPAGETF